MLLIPTSCCLKQSKAYLARRGVDLDPTALPSLETLSLFGSIMEKEVLRLLGSLLSSTVSTKNVPRNPTRLLELALAKLTHHTFSRCVNLVECPLQAGRLQGRCM